MNPNAKYGVPITPREFQVIRLYVTDHSKKEIADLLGMSIHGIHAHTTNIYVKLGLNTQMQLLGWAMREGHVTAEDVKGIKPKARYHG